MQQDDSVDAPGGTVTWAKNLYLTRGRRPSLVRRIVGALQADLLPNRALVGERSSSAARARQMLFAAEDNGIDLRITGVRRKFGIKGQILGAGFENTPVHLSGNEASFETKTDESATFELVGVPAGIYSLTLKNDGAEIVLEGIDLNL